MSAALDLPSGGLPARWIRLHTLIILRWFAIGGQMAAILVAWGLYDLDIHIGLCLAAVGLGAVANLAVMVVYPDNKRLSGREAVSLLLFDIVQLAILLFLTGGLHNPFAVLMLAPVTIAATFLRLRQTILLGLVAILLLTLVAQINLPIVRANGAPLEIPPLSVFGFWLALVIGVVFLGLYAHRITSEMRNMSEALTATQLALAREQKLTDLGGVVAAAAHELGTPLATIKLVSSELIEELEDRPDLKEDAALIRQQADRCRDILRSMGRAGKDDLHLHRAPLETVVREAAEPHLSRGKSVWIAAWSDNDEARQPTIERRPEIIHGLRNLIQNAVDFAAEAVRIEVVWDASQITIRISDDGTGFPSQVLSRIGDPFVGRRRTGARPGYDGMGLGLFIAKTLLERSGATLHFANSTKGDGLGGAEVDVAWPREKIEALSDGVDDALGENRLIVA
ncbi:sensor histidine kinase RegB [Aestuariibius sp. 2305UL40-4]|uniref:sensor histidine kinase RegB n=1 Tax=Aestuariibius violaceus TaxID=3234132 RepID=UPI00345EED94